MKLAGIGLVRVTGILWAGVDRADLNSLCAHLTRNNKR